MTTEMDALARQLAHCDGVDCTCAAWGACECGCDADWTPAEVYKLRARVQELERENGELRAMRDGWRTVAYQGKDCVAAARVEIDALRERAERAESELAAIKRRIAEAATGIAKRSLAPGCLVIEGFDDDPSDYHGERVALLPPDDEAKS